MNWCDRFTLSTISGLPITQPGAPLRVPHDRRTELRVSREADIIGRLTEQRHEHQALLGGNREIMMARVLAREIRAHGVTSAAVLAYEDERRAATTSIVLANRGNGPEQVMQTVEERAPDGFTRIDNVLSAMELQEAAAGYKRMAGFDKDILNNRGPIVPP